MMSSGNILIFFLQDILFDLMHIYFYEIQLALIGELVQEVVALSIRDRHKIDVGVAVEELFDLGYFAIGKHSFEDVILSHCSLHRNSNLYLLILIPKRS